MAANKNAGALTVAQAVRQLSGAYTAYINGGIPLKLFPSVMLWGPPGVGKSQGVRQIADEIGEKTGRDVHMTDVRLLLFNPVDLRGIPTANEDRTLAVWLRPKIFQMDDSEDVINILFLDEISAAPASVQAAAYQITLDRTVGEHKLPENCIVIAAGNRVTDRSVAYNMPKALANRLCHMEIKSDAASWHEWAVGAGVNSIVVGFIDNRPDMLMDFDPELGEMSFPTPRSWEMVSHILDHVSENVSEVFPLISGCVGPTAATALRNWSEVYRKLPSIKDIFAGEAVGIPTKPELLFALSSRIPSYARSHSSAHGLINAVVYASRLPAEFRERIYTDLLAIRSIRKTLAGISEYNEWFLGSGREWEDFDIT